MGPDPMTRVHPLSPYSLPAGPQGAPIEPLFNHDCASTELLFKPCWVPSTSLRLKHKALTESQLNPSWADRAQQDHSKTTNETA
eukprot:13530639-Alexandrium_andersonii.AAC.1